MKLKGEPAIVSLQECLSELGNDKSSAQFRERLTKLLDLIKTMDFVMGQLAAQESNAVLPRLLKLLA